jgi:hypothetical protein
VTNYAGAPVTPEQVLATTPFIQQELIALIAEAGDNS